MISNPNELLLLNLINNSKRDSNNIDRRSPEWDIKFAVKSKLNTIKTKIKKNKLYVYYIKFLKLYLPISSIAKLIWDIIMVANYSNGGYLFLI